MVECFDIAIETEDKHFTFLMNLSSTRKEMTSEILSGEISKDSHNAAHNKNVLALTCPHIWTNEKNEQVVDNVDMASLYLNEEDLYYHVIHHESFHIATSVMRILYNNKTPFILSAEIDKNEEDLDNLCTNIERGICETLLIYGYKIKHEYKLNIINNIKKNIKKVFKIVSKYERY
jgi:hypothetical protein